MLARRGQATARPAVLTGSWVALLFAGFVVAGRTGLGTLLTAAFILQVTPSLWTAYRTTHLTGVAAGTWLLILGDLSCWTIFGLDQSDPRLLTLGVTGVTASALMLARIRRTPLPRRRRSVIPRRLVTSGSGLPAQPCLVGIQRLLELPPFHLRKDLNEHHHDDTGPQGVTERIEQVGHQAKRFGRRRRFEQVATDMSGQANHEGDPEAPVQESLLVHRPPHLRQVLAYPGQDRPTFPLP
jgi:hypothetical protein